MDSSSQSGRGTWSGYTPTERAMQVQTECIDRPVWLAAVTLCQLLNPADYIHLNHALAIGSTIPVLPIDDSRVEILNKFIDIVWGEGVVLVVPIVVTSHETSGRQPYLGLVHPKTPVPGLRVTTRQVMVEAGEVIDEVVGQIKSEYKHQGPSECVTAGCNLLLSSIMGNLVIQPPRPSRIDNRSLSDHHPEKDNMTRGRRRSNSHHSLHHKQRSHSARHLESTRHTSRTEQNDSTNFLTSRLWRKIQDAIIH
jgi:hypothetical protein